MSSLHFPTMASHRGRLFEQTVVVTSPLKHSNKQNSLSSRVATRDPSVAPAKKLKKSENQSHEGRRNSFPPIPLLHDHTTVAPGKPRRSIPEIVTRMSSREQTLSGDNIVSKGDGRGEGDDSKLRVNDSDAALTWEDRAGGENYASLVLEKENVGSSNAPINHTTEDHARIRNNGNVMALKTAWGTPRNPHGSNFEPRRVPILSRNVRNRRTSENPAVDQQRCTDTEFMHIEFEESSAANDHVSDDESEFNLDEDESEAEAEDQPGRSSHTTTAVYQRACHRLKIQPTAAFLRQSNVLTMDLRDVRLGPADVKPIAIALVRDAKLFSLDLSNNQLGPVGVSYIAEMLQENSALFDLNLSATNPGREGVKALAENLRHNRSLGYLRLEENGIEHTEAPILADMIQSAPALQGLFLGHNKLGYTGGAAIASAVAQNKTLTILDLQWNHIRRDSGVALVRALATNSSLRQLNLAWNGLGKEGCLALAYSLPKNTTLRELDLTCNRVDLMSLGFLLKGLAMNTQLSTLKIGQNPLTTEGAKELMAAIAVSPNMAITEIDLTGVPVDEEFSELVSRAKNSRLLNVKHEETNSLATSDMTREHDGNNLSRYDPVMVLFEYMKLDNLRVIDMFQYMDVKKRDKLSKSDIRDGLNTLRIPVTEHAIDVIVQKLDLNKDGFVELDEMMKVQRDTARYVKLRQIRAKSKNKEDESLNSLHQILRDVIAKRTEENESRRESQSRRRSSVGGQQRKQTEAAVNPRRSRWRDTLTKLQLKTIPGE